MALATFAELSEALGKAVASGDARKISELSHAMATLAGTQLAIQQRERDAKLVKINEALAMAVQKTIERNGIANILGEPVTRVIISLYPENPTAVPRVTYNTGDKAPRASTPTREGHGGKVSLTLNAKSFTGTRREAARWVYPQLSPDQRTRIAKTYASWPEAIFRTNWLAELVALTEA